MKMYILQNNLYLLDLFTFSLSSDESEITMMLNVSCLLAVFVCLHGWALLIISTSSDGKFGNSRK